MANEERPQRLCSEIQLFDLCDLDVCGHKDGRYCTKGDILQRFEAIKEEDERSPEQYLAEELDEVEGGEDLGYDEAYGVDEYEDD
ncbi:hypothetical protein [Geomesophilobacter sediminis]|uniref:Uncharacterized protein n=1 Tax=Geomesophilobacter sediminis TaxID=2798584 RepID=A0A8J7LY00_9BACT|nr:hypothetical protein [Geomesophilobacter sediminis]MBJ6724006.1 hypothetical protein [Geomesophilobacter sediminis]